LFNYIRHITFTRVRKDVTLFGYQNIRMQARLAKRSRVEGRIPRRQWCQLL